MFFSLCFSQTKNKENLIDGQINKIDWTSFQVSTNYFVQIALNDSLINKLGYNDSILICKLFNHLSINSKTVTIHVLLTHIFEPQNGSFSCSYNAEGSIINYCYNNLKWRYDLKAKRYVINKNEIRSIRSYWKKVINNNFKIEH